MIAIKFERGSLVVASLLAQRVNVFVEKQVDSFVHLLRIQSVGKAAVDFGVTFEKEVGRVKQEGKVFVVTEIGTAAMAYEIRAKVARRFTRDEMNNFPVTLFRTVVADAKDRVVKIARIRVVTSMTDASHVNHVWLARFGRHVNAPRQRFLGSLDRKSFLFQVGVDVLLAIVEPCLGDDFESSIDGQHY